MFPSKMVIKYRRTFMHLALNRWYPKIVGKFALEDKLPNARRGSEAEGAIVSY